MIEKIMKAVKSNNKKRGRNITVGAVVGMLLSCTVVMGADVTGLEITKNGENIEFKDKGGKKFEPGTENDPYSENTWEEGTKTYTNNTLISEENSSGSAYGIQIDGGSEKIDFNFVNKGTILVENDSTSNSTYGIKIQNLGDDSNLNLTNDGMISVTGASTNPGSFACGIYLGSNKIITLTNNGLISATAPPSGNAYGVSISSDDIFENNGLILSTKTGIYGDSVNHGIIKNNGMISATRESDSYGIHLKESSGGALTNNGFISAKNTTLGYGYGVCIIGDAANNGLVLGKNVVTGVYSNTLKNAGVISISDSNKSGRSTYTVNVSGGSITNYGLLVNSGTDVTNSSSLTNYGLNITGSTGVVTEGDSTLTDGKVTVGYNKTIDGDGEAKYTEIQRKMTIKNATITDGSGLGTSTTSLEFTGKDDEFDNSILNGKGNTLKISGEDVDREVKGSIINAYESAVEFDGVNQKKLTLSGTIVNGGAGVDSSTGRNFDAISGSYGNDTLILQSGEIKYIDGTTETPSSQHTIINGNISMGTGNDVLTIGNGTIINGTLDGGTNFVIDALSGIADRTEKDTLNLGIAGESSNSEGIRIQHDISNFENINVDTNVTFYEKTNDDDGKEKDLEITGANEIKIGAEGTLTLRIDTTNKDGEKIKGHALYKNNGTITSEGGKLLLALNGAGNKSIISFGNTVLGDGLDSNAFDTTSKLHTVKKLNGSNEVKVVVRGDLPEYLEYKHLNKIYHGIISVEDLIGNFNVDDDEKLSTFLAYLNDIYAGNPYSYSSELSRKSAGMFRDIVTENIFRPETNKWMIYGGLTHVDGGTKDTYYGKGYYTYDIGSSDMDADTKITGAYMLGEYGVSDTLTSGVIIGGNKLKSDLSNSSKVDGSALYLGAYAKKYVGNLKVTAGAGFQYGDYDADRIAVNKVASSTAEPVMKYSDNYNDMTYDIYLNGRYSHQVGDNLFLEPYATLSYTYIDQDGTNEGSKVLAIETDSKSFDYTVGKVGVDLKKVIPHEKGKSILSAGVSYTKILDGADEEYITGRFKGGSDFDILVAHKNEHSIGLNAKYALELESGVIFDVKGTYSVERDSHNGSAKNKTKGEWIVGAGVGYKF